MLRGVDRRQIELSELSVQEWPQSEGPSACYVLVVQSTKSKTNRTGDKYYMGAMRHKDVELCSLNAVAQYLFWRWHIAGEQPPSFKSRSQWYRLKLLVAGDDPTQMLSYTAQYNCCQACLQEAGVAGTGGVTHCMRGCGA
jgi:hypothetical protein